MNAPQAARSPPVEWLAVFSQFYDSLEIALRRPGVLESLPKHMGFEVEGFREIGLLMEHIVHQSQSLIKITLRFEKPYFVDLARPPILS